MYENLSDAKRALLWDEMVKNAVKKNGVDNVDEENLTKVFQTLMGEISPYESKAVYYRYVPKEGVNVSEYPYTDYPEMYDRETLITNAGDNPLTSENTIRSGLLGSNQTLAVSGEESSGDSSDDSTNDNNVVFVGVTTTPRSDLVDNQQSSDAFLADLYSPTETDRRPWRWMPENIGDNFNGITQDDPQQFADEAPPAVVPVVETPVVIQPSVVIASEPVDIVNYSSPVKTFATPNRITPTPNSNPNPWLPSRMNSPYMGNRPTLTSTIDPHRRRKPSIQKTGRPFRKGLSL